MNVERTICNRVINALLDAGYTVGVNDGVETTVKEDTSIKGIMQAIQTTEEDYILAYKDGKQVGWVWFVWGNDEDVITDHTTNLTEILEPVFAWIETLT